MHLERRRHNDAKFPSTGGSMRGRIGAIRASALLHPTVLRLPCLYAVSTLSADGCAAPILMRPKLPDTISASFAATGRGWRHPTFTCRRPAPGRKARWPKIQEARCDRFRRGVSNAAEPATAERHMAGSGLHGVRPAGSDPYGRPQLAAGHKSPRRGCRKATRCGGRKPSIGCGVGARVPVAPRRRAVGGAGGVEKVRRCEKSRIPGTMSRTNGRSANSCARWEREWRRARRPIRRPSRRRSRGSTSRGR